LIGGNDDDVGNVVNNHLLRVENEIMAPVYKHFQIMLVSVSSKVIKTFMVGSIFV